MVAEMGAWLDSEKGWQPVVARWKRAKPGGALVGLREEGWLAEPFGSAEERVVPRWCGRALPRRGDSGKRGYQPRRLRSDQGSTNQDVARFSPATPQVDP